MLLLRFNVVHEIRKIARGSPENKGDIIFRLGPNDPAYALATPTCTFLINLNFGRVVMHDDTFH
jgi:hypothetical protein